MTHVRRKLITLPLVYAAAKEAEMPADSILYEAAGPGPGNDDLSINLVLAAPEGASMVKRMVWMCKTGEDVPVSAQEDGASFMGMITYTGFRLLIFVESQSEALIRAQHRRRF